MSLSNEEFNSNLVLLTPGSVWLKGDSKKVSVLMVTNTTLPERLQKKFPPQVVYVNEEGNYYNRSVENFFEIHQFYNINPELESRLENLIVFDMDNSSDEDLDAEIPEEEGEEEEDDQPVQVFSMDGNGVVENSSESDESNEVQAKAKKQTLAEYLAYGDDSDESASNSRKSIDFAFSQGLQPAINADDLRNSFVSYTQEPNGSLNLTVHKLMFELSESVSLANLKDVFIPDDERSIVDAFKLKSSFYEEVIAWTDYIGVFPEIRQGRAYGVVHIATETAPVISEQEAESHIHLGTGTDSGAGIGTEENKPLDEQDSQEPGTLVVDALNSTDELTDDETSVDGILSDVLSTVTGSSESTTEVISEVESDDSSDQTHEQEVGEVVTDVEFTENLLKQAHAH